MPDTHNLNNVSIKRKEEILSINQQARVNLLIDELRNRLFRREIQGFEIRRINKRTFEIRILHE